MSQPTSSISTPGVVLVKDVEPSTLASLVPKSATVHSNSSSDPGWLCKITLLIFVAPFLDTVISYGSKRVWFRFECTGPVAYAYILWGR